VTAVRKRRASGAPGGGHSARWLEADDVGTWLLVEPGTPYVHDEGWVFYLSPNPILVVVPDGGHWVASTSHVAAKVDLCSRVVVGPDLVEFVDIELDVVWQWGQPARIEDVEEFRALALAEAEANRYLAEAERIRAAVDAGRAPFGPAFRQRLVDLTGAGDPQLQATWAGGVGPYLAEQVAAMVGARWLDRQRAGEGWLLCGGGSDLEVTAVVWVDGHGGHAVLDAGDPRMAAYLMDTAPGLQSYPAPLLPPP
jgi:hypothetical protein